MKNIGFFGFFVLFAATPVMAEESGVTPEQLVSMAQGTRAMDMLNQIFGSMLTIGEAGPLSGMILVFNTSLGAIAALMLIWASLSVTLETAFKGEVFGRKISKWLPIRYIFSLACIFPVAGGGYCVAQKFMFLAAAAGIGLASSVAGLGIPALIESAADRPLVAGVAIEKDRPLQALLRAQVCAIAYNSQYYGNDGKPLVEGAPPAFEVHAGDVPRALLPIKDYQLTYGGTGKYDYAPDYCGGVSIPADAGGEVEGVIGPLLSAKDVRNAHIAALTGMANDLMPISTALYHEHKKPTPASLADIKNRYNATVSKTIAAVLARNSATMKEVLQSGGGELQKPSWIELGFVFNKISKIYREVHAATNIEPEIIQPLVVPGDIAASRAADGIALANTFISQADPAERVPAVADSMDMGDKLGLAMKKIQFATINKSLGLFLAGGEDLLAGMTNFGYATYYVLIGGIGIVFAIASAAGVLSTTAGLSIMGWASLILLAPIAYSLTCAFYVPLIPMIFWYSGVLSWLIIVVEGIIAAPIWMIAHLDLDGDGMGNRSEYGYLFLLNILFRPTLMVFGLVVGWLATNAAGKLLRWGVSLFFVSGSGDISTLPIRGPGGLGEIILFLSLFCLVAHLSMVTIKKCYSLVSVLPDQTLGWIGRAANNMIGDIEQTVSHGMGGAAHTAGSETSTAARTGISDRKAGLGRGGGISKGPGEG